MSVERAPIILLSPGRSGSSVLQQSLNTSEQIVMWGEHSGFLAPLSRAYDILAYDETLSKMHYNDRIPGRRDALQPVLDDPSLSVNWTNAFDLEDVHERFRGLVHDLLAKGLDRSKVHWGFKEIRYREPSSFMRFWKDLFPNTKFLILIRDPAPTVRSMFLAWTQPAFPDKQIENMLDHLQQGAELWRDLALSLAKWNADPEIDSHLIRFEELERDPRTVVGKLFEDLGLPMPPGAIEPFKNKLAFTRDRPHRELVDQLMREHADTFEDTVGEAARAFGYSGRP